MASVGSAIPIVDFSAMSLEQNDPLKTNKKAVDFLADEIFHAFSTIGFVYLKNHGIPQELVDCAFETYDKFFDLELDVKQKYAKTEGTSLDGWDALERESLNPQRPGDLKESFDVGTVYDENFNWPNAEIPTFQNTIATLYQYLSNLALRVLSVMAIGLKLEPNVFEYAYINMGRPGGGARLRSLFYPLVDVNKIKPGQIRCGEHTDYGGITLLLQDDVGGLEVTNVEGKFVPAPPIERTVLVNIADLMQRWTDDKLISTIHRVLIPEIQIKRRVPRRCIAFFVNPDGEALITSLKGLDKYPPMTAKEWAERKLLATYGY